MSNEEASNSEVDIEVATGEVSEQENTSVEGNADVQAEDVEGDNVEVIEAADLSPEELQTQLNAALEKAQAAEEKSLRIAADLQNVRRRGERDVENAHKYAVDKFVLELLPVIDGLERGLEAVPEDDDAQKTSRKKS